MAKPVRLGVLCAATIVKKNARGLTMADGIDIVAIGSSSLEKAQDMVKGLQEFLPADCKALGSYDELLDYDIDAVYIPLPSAKHVEWVQKAAEKGLHILLEKPIAANKQDLDAVMAACEKYNVQFMDGTMWSHHPRTRQLEGLIRDQQKFGPVVQVNATLHTNVPEGFHETNIRAFPDADPLGCLGDFGWYTSRAAVWAFGCEAPEYVWAHPGKLLPCEEDVAMCYHPALLQVQVQVQAQGKLVCTACNTSRVSWYSASRNDKGVLTYVAATLVWPDVSGTPRRRAVFTNAFDLGLTQVFEIYSPKASVMVRDFQTPFNEKKCSYTYTHDHGFAEMETYDATKRDEVWVDTPQPQESCMWEEFANCVRNIRDKGGKPDKRWLELSRITAQTMLAVDLSLQKGSACIKVADMQPCSPPN